MFQPLYPALSVSPIIELVPQVEIDMLLEPLRTSDEDASRDKDEELSANVFQSSEGTFSISSKTPSQRNILSILLFSLFRYHFPVS